MNQHAVVPDRPTAAVPPGMDPAEWDLRVNLAAFYRIVDHMGWSHLIHNHITVRLPGPEHHFLTNPYGLLYSEMTASGMIKVDLDGNKLSASPWPINPAGFVIHSAVHASSPDAICIIHTHTKSGLAVACSRQGLLNNNFYSAQIFGQIAYHDFEGVTRRLDERERLVQSIGDKPICILRNHGLLVCGRTIPETFFRYMTVQFACDVQLAAASMGGETIPISDA
ncbi:MAG TPA: class II aldolase/adducin family protein, partial [Hyphomicrobiales bacterium]|nr:class II aldolase/adducin family protein [Hyphomicrobiales bacterium]